MPAFKNDPQNQYAQRVRKSQIFNDILAQAHRSGLARQNAIDAAEWYHKKAKALGKDVAPEDLMSDESRLKTQFVYGKMYHFFYVPRWKDDIDKLPYYDLFPLIFPVQPAPVSKKNGPGFYGINLHYLAPQQRASLMDALYDLRNNDRYDTSTKLVMSYRILKRASSMSAFQPTFKHYLKNFVYSKFYSIETISEWAIALFLPTERFVRATRSQVWADSRKIISGR